MHSGTELYAEALDEVSKKTPDVEKVLGLLNRSLATGDSQAAYALGTWYLHGYETHVKKDIRKAIQLLRQAANGNVPDAVYDMAVSYETGVGVKKNPKLAMEYYLRAALLGEKQSFFEVGRCYYHGIGIEQNKRLAKIWYDRAEELGVHD